MRSLLHRIWASAPRRVRRLFVWLKEPHFIASTAAAITNDSGEILLCRHVFRRGPAWGMPGGFLQKGEDPEEAIRRELREELSVELHDLELVLVRTFPRTRQLEILYRCTVYDAPRIDSVEVVEVQWFRPDALPEVSRDQKRLIGRVLESAQRISSSSTSNTSMP